jgi:hypothetical protein
MSASYEEMKAHFKLALCEAFGVTEEEVDAFDAAMGGPLRRAQEKNYRERVIPSVIAHTKAQMEGLLPSGVTLEFESVNESSSEETGREEATTP